MSPTLAAISAARGFVNLELGHFARTHTLLRFHLNSSPSVSPARWKKLGQFFKQIHVGWKCKLMIWSFNHSGANPDAEEFPADSGSSDFTNPRQHQPLKQRSSYCCCNSQDCPFHGELVFGFALPGLCCMSGDSRLVPKKWLLLLQPSCPFLGVCPVHLGECQICSQKWK